MAVPSWNDFLDRLQRDGVIRRVDPRTMQAVEELLDAGLAHAPEEFAAALASLLATTPEQWKQVQTRFRAFVAEPEVFLGGALPVEEPPPAPPTGIELRVEPAPGSARNSLHRWLEWLATRRLRRAVGGVLLVLSAAFALGVTAGVVVALRSVDVALHTPAPLDMSETEVEVAPLERDPAVETGSTTGGDGEPPVESESSTSDAERPADVPEVPAPGVPPSSPVFIAALMLISTALVGVGLRWISAPTAQRRRAMELHDRYAADAQGPRVLYKVASYPPFPVAAMDAAATLLARLPMAGHGLDLDVAATLHATVRAGGRTTPVLAPTRAAQELTVLVDLERGDHPFRSGVEWVLHRWAQGGLRFVRLDFEHHPTVLRTHIDRRDTNLDAFGRRTEGSPLVLFARATQLREYDGGHGWLRQLGPWPLRAIVDLDPRADDDPALLPEERESRRALARAHFRRFPFTAAGLTAMAQYVGSRGVVQVPTPDERLRPTAEIAEQLDKWASCLACVPDPSWAQLEVFRREFFAFELPDPRYIQRLLDWVSRPLPGGIVPDDPITADGTRINLPRSKVHQHLARLTRADPLGRGRDLEVRAREVIQQQLRGSDPQAEGDRRLRDLKLAQHAAILRTREPGEGGETSGLEVFVGGAMEEDLERWVADQEARYGEAGEDAPVWLRDLRRSLVHADLQLLHLRQWLTLRGLLEVAPGTLVLAGAAWMVFGALPTGVFTIVGAVSGMAGALSWVFWRTLRPPRRLGFLDERRGLVEAVLCALAFVLVLRQFSQAWPESSLALIGLAGILIGPVWFAVPRAWRWMTHEAFGLVWISTMCIVLSKLDLVERFTLEARNSSNNTLAAITAASAVAGLFWFAVRRERRGRFRLQPQHLALAASCLLSAGVIIWLSELSGANPFPTMAYVNVLLGVFPWAVAVVSAGLGRDGFGRALSVLNLLVGLQYNFFEFYLLSWGFSDDSLPSVLFTGGSLLMVLAGGLGLVRLVASPADSAATRRLGPITAPPTGRALGVVEAALAGVAPMRFVGLTGGEFTMGSPDSEQGRLGWEGPQHRVHVSPFAITEHLVTQRQWREIMGDNPSDPTYGIGDDFPVNNVSWFDALEFLNRLSAREGRRPCYSLVGENQWIWNPDADGYRLPTEAEWEYAARAGTTTAYSFGESPEQLDQYAWYSGNSGGRLHRVGELRPNPWRLFDMHGLLFEWVWDAYNRYGRESMIDPSVSVGTGDSRVLRGGPLVRGARHLRSARRYGGRPWYRVRINGFRCVRGTRP